MRAVSFGGIKIYKPFPASVNNRFEILFKTNRQVNFVIETGVNGSAIYLDAYLRTDDIRKSVDEDQKQCQTQDRASGNTSTGGEPSFHSLTGMVGLNQITVL